jgi:hypothetical protein
VAGHGSTTTLTGAVVVANEKSAAAVSAMRGERIGVVDPLPTAATASSQALRSVLRSMAVEPVAVV